MTIRSVMFAAPWPLVTTLSASMAFANGNESTACEEYQDLAEAINASSKT